MDEFAASRSIVTKETKLSKIFGINSLTSLVAVLIIIWLVYVFVTGSMYRFYASALFLFYALTKKMWVSVMMLGVFQTFILVPIRIIRVQRQNNIKQFQKAIEEQPTPGLQLKKVRDSYQLGNRTFLFYLVDFMVQLMTFLTIGRLFLTDFYLTKLDPSRLYDFVPYPAYPIQDTWFKLPYFVITDTVSLGFKWVLIGWTIVIGLYLLILMVRRIRQRQVGEGTDQESTKMVNKYTGGSVVMIMLLVWFVLTHLPVAAELKIFTGDVSVPNRTLNTITALSTFGLMVYFGIPKIIRQGRIALQEGIARSKVEQTQKDMFRETVLTATFVGLGAYFITNQIPSAFELSIFTLELISLASPLTLDRLILQSQTKSG